MMRPIFAPWLGLACTLLALYFIILGIYYAAMIGMVWAVAFDWADGLLARRMQGRTGEDRSFGAQLDVLIDIVSYGVAPAMLLLSYGNYELIFLAVAFVVVAAGVMRLAYFATYGLSDNSSYTGLALDNNSLVLVALFMLESVVSKGAFSMVLLGSCLGLAALNVSQLKTSKLSGNSKNVWLLGIYTISISSIYCWKLL